MSVVGAAIQEGMTYCFAGEVMARTKHKPRCWLTIHFLVVFVDHFGCYFISTLPMPLFTLGNKMDEWIYDGMLIKSTMHHDFKKYTIPLLAQNPFSRQPCPFVFLVQRPVSLPSVSPELSHCHAPFERTW